MRSSFKLSSFQWIASFWLIILIHLDGFRQNPAAFLTALKWWILRKKVRARGQFAPLLSKSSKAYLYWLLIKDRDRMDPSPAAQEPPILALVATKGSNIAMVELTMRSIVAEGLEAVTISENWAEDLAVAAENVNWQKRPWLLPLAAGDQLARGAAATYRRELETTAASVLFADDDVLDKRGRRTEPHFKPDWNAELFSHHDYITGACIIRGDSSSLSAAASERDWAGFLVARALQTGTAHHVRQVLHQRATRSEPPRNPNPLPIAHGLPKVCVIVPTRNRVDLLRTCLEGLARTQYPEIEIIVVDNDSDDPSTLAYLAELAEGKVRVLQHPGAFNYSTINNRAAAVTEAPLLCLLNNDIEVINPDWLAVMATQALRDNVGAVGAQLLYPDGRIQHAGVVIGVGNAAGHAHRFVRPEAAGYFRRHALPQFTTAVTGACLVVSRSKFQSVGGLDEHNFPVAYNDVDLCLRLNQRGWQSFYEPRAVLIHHESVSRGLDKDPVGAARFAGELAALQRLWHTDKAVDPYHHPQLSRASEQYVIGL
jgi:GT2 family glycosyltransferase